MKLLDQLGRLEAQLSGQTGAKQVVVAVPVAPLIERNDEQIGASERLQLARRTSGRQDRVTKWAIHPIQDRRAQQQFARVRVEVGEDLVAEIVDDMPVIPRESHDEPVPVGRLRSDNPAR